jgi:predicted DNA-binding protein (UPF0251 family)
MHRPCRRRLIEQMPAVCFFKPQGILLWQRKTIHLTLDELEAMRLVDGERIYQEIYQEDAAVWMNISRPTLARILDSGRRKTTQALLKGEALAIEGGNTQLIASPSSPGCRFYGCRGWVKNETSKEVSDLCKI